MKKVFVALGSNLGNRLQFLQEAISCLIPLTNEKIELSGVYETSPVGGPSGQLNYLNQVVAFYTNMTPMNLLLELKKIEKKLGRKSRKRWDSREIDLDILFFGDMVVNTDRLQIPHPRIAERLFVLEPLCEISKDKLDPISGMSMQKMLNNCRILQNQTQSVNRILLKDEVACAIA